MGFNSVFKGLMGANGTISELFGGYLNSVPGRHDIKELLE
jgi:hypothetical protein